MYIVIYRNNKVSQLKLHMYFVYAGHDTPYAAMGGLTGFSSLADGYMRLDPSGRGELLILNVLTKSLDTQIEWQLVTNKKHRFYIMLVVPKLCGLPPIYHLQSLVRHLCLLFLLLLSFL